MLANRNIMTAEIYYASFKEEYSLFGQMLQAIIEDNPDSKECGEKLIEFLLSEKEYNHPIEIAKMVMSASEEVQKVFSENAILQKKWQDDLAAHGFKRLALRSMDGKPLSLFHQYLAYAAYIDDEIDIACNSGLLEPLSERCESNTKLISQMNPDDDYQPLLMQIDSDLSAICNLYWQPGYLCVARLALEVALAILSIDSDISGTYKSAALKYFICARILDENTSSQALVKCMTDGVGVGDFFTDPELRALDWKNSPKEAWLKVEMYLRSNFDDYDRQADAADFEMQPFKPVLQEPDHSDEEKHDEKEGMEKDSILASASHSRTHGLHRPQKSIDDQKKELLQQVGGRKTPPPK